MRGGRREGGGEEGLVEIFRFCDAEWKEDRVPVSCGALD